MVLFKLFQARSKSFYAFVVLLGLTGSATNVGILMLINSALGGKSLPFLAQNDAWVFFSLVLVSFTAGLFFQAYMVRLSNEIMYTLELNLIRKIRAASFESFEKMGSEKIYAAIGDTRILSRVPETLVTFINSTATIICAMLYFFWVSPIACLTVIVLMAALLALYLVQNRRVEKDLNKLRDLQDGYYASLRELINGFKQIRISSRRSENLFNLHLLANKKQSKDLSIKAAKRIIVTELSGSYSWFLVIGFVLFVLPAFLSISVPQLAAFITTVLFMIAPVSQLIMFVPLFTTFKIAVERITKVERLLEADASLRVVSRSDFADFSTIRFKDIYYRYDMDEETTFHLDILELTMEKGEVVFIVGGNGSGKTTFLHLLTGLCKPLSGQIFIDEELVSWEDFRAFSNRMAVVYTQHHLFQENYDGHDLVDRNSMFGYWTEILNLKGIIKVDAKKNWVDTRLSKGQQKRVALLLALMEDKPLLVLDEWAAEQDPLNRKLFYQEWLGLIKAMGKTVIAVSHDDEYYHIADRVVKFNQGTIASDVRRHSELVP